jgi:acid phosphatase family membrane protein YuiD
MSDLFTYGERLRDAGIEKVLTNNPSYRERFASAAAHSLETYGEVTSDTVVQAIGMPEGHPSAIGGAMRSFALANGLTVKRYVKSTHPSRHAAIIAVWGK